jgi:hypothetical protein
MDVNVQATKDRRDRQAEERRQWWLAKQDAVRDRP